jgi:hypothetical protein
MISFSVDNSGDDSATERVRKKRKKNKSTSKAAKKKRASSSEIIVVDSDDENNKASKSGIISTVANLNKTTVNQASYTAAPADGAADSSASLTSNTDILESTNVVASMRNNTVSQ